MSTNAATPPSTKLKAPKRDDWRHRAIKLNLNFRFYYMTKLWLPSAWSRMNPSRERKRAVGHEPATKVANAQSRRSITRANLRNVDVGTPDVRGGVADSGPTALLRSRLGFFWPRPGFLELNKQRCLLISLYQRDL
jgi:hypothetical protein